MSAYIAFLIATLVALAAVPSFGATKLTSFQVTAVVPQVCSVSTTAPANIGSGVPTVSVSCANDVVSAGASTTAKSGTAKISGDGRINYVADRTLVSGIQSDISSTGTITVTITY
jgi:hypothetical protein